MLALQCVPLRRRLRRPVHAGGQRIEARDGWLVCLRDATGCTGLGEVAPLEAFGTETPAEAEAALAGLDAGLLAVPEGPDGFAGPESIAALRVLGGLGPAARFGVETALLDLAAQRAGVPLCDWLAGPGPTPSRPRRIAVNALLAEADPAAREEEALAAVATGFAVLKCKLADAGPGTLAALVGLRARLGSGPALRIDWNGSLRPEEAQRALHRLRGHGIEYAEQPLAAQALDEMALLRRADTGAGRVAIAADESAVDAGAVRAVLRRGAADVLVLKPATLGGLLATRALAAQARAAGVEVVVTSLLDGAVAQAAAAHLVASLPAPRRAAGLATAQALEGDARGPLPVVRGHLELSEAPGLGIRP